MSLRFEWNARKAALNLKQHGISFSEASTVFGDPLSITINDPDHSESEQRFLDVGRSNLGRLIVVSYTERGERIRIISARPPTQSEQRQYEEAQ